MSLNIVEEVIKKSALIARVVDRRRMEALLSENFNAIFQSENTKIFTDRYNIVDEDELTKRQKYLLSKVLSNFTNRKPILDQYNNSMMENKRFNNQTNLFRDMNHILELMQGHPYDDVPFREKAVKKLIEWSMDEDKENVRLLKKALNFHVDRNTLNEFLSDNSVKKAEAFKYLKGLEQADKTECLKCRLATGIAGLVSLGVFTTMVPISDIMNTMLPFAEKLVGASPAVTAALSVVGTAVAFYSAFKTVNEVGQKILEEKKEGLLLHSSPKDMSRNAFKTLTTERLLGQVMLIDNFDSDQKKNERYLILNGFLNQKLYNSSFRVSEDLAKNLHLSRQQIVKLNGLSQDDIHELSLIQNPSVRTKMAMNQMTHEQKASFKTVAVIHGIEDRKNLTGVYFSEIAHVKNMSSKLKERVYLLPEIDQDILKSYLDLYMDKESNCSRPLLNRLEKSLNDKRTVNEFVQSEVEMAYFNKSKEQPTNQVWDYIKRVGKLLVGKEEIVLINPKTREKVKEIEKEFGFDSLNGFNCQKQNFLNKTKNFTLSVLDNIKKIRDNIDNSSNNNIRPN